MSSDRTSPGSPELTTDGKAHFHTSGRPDGELDWLATISKVNGSRLGARLQLPGTQPPQGRLPRTSLLEATAVASMGHSARQTQRRNSASFGITLEQIRVGERRIKCFHEGNVQPPPPSPTILILTVPCHCSGLKAPNKQHRAIPAHRTIYVLYRV